jgi:hypothetical protein
MEFKNFFLAACPGGSYQFLSEPPPGLRILRAAVRAKWLQSPANVMGSAVTAQARPGGDRICYTGLFRLALASAGTAVVGRGDPISESVSKPLWPSILIA